MTDATPAYPSWCAGGHPGDLHESGEQVITATPVGVLVGLEQEGQGPARVVVHLTTAFGEFHLPLGPDTAAHLLETFRAMVTAGGGVP